MIKTHRRQLVSARSVCVEAPDLLAIIGTTGHRPAKGKAELDLERPAQEGEAGYVDVQTYLAVLTQELLRCRSELAAIKRSLEVAK